MLSLLHTRCTLLLLLLITLCTLPALTVTAQEPVLLRDVWNKNVSDTPPVTHLLYDRGNAENSFEVPLYRISLKSPPLGHYVYSLPDFSPTVFALDQQCIINSQQIWITCQITNNKSVALSINHYPDLNSRLIAKPRSGNVIYYKWSPDGKYLAFTDRDDDTSSQAMVSIYDVERDEIAFSLGPFYSRDIIGWRNEHELLLLAKVIDDTAYQVLSFDIVSRKTEIVVRLAEINGRYISSFNLAPNGRFALTAQIDSEFQVQQCVYDFDTRQCTPYTRPFDANLYWSPDGSGMLALGRSLADPSYFIPADNPSAIIPVTIPPPPESDIRFDYLSLQSSSPDGRYLVFYQSSNIRYFYNRMLLFDIAANRWIPLSNTIFHVVGWTTEPQTVDPFYPVFLPISAR